jgi:outer membrane protein TolC
MRRRLALAVVVAAALAAPGPASGQAPLTPAEVLAAVDRALPLLDKARREVDAASGALLASQGAFDLTVSAYGQRLTGDYDNTRFSGLLEQPLAPWGITAYGGYKAGRGDFASYDSKALTRSAGEVLAGIEVPLLRGRAIDERRADRQAAQLGVELAGRELDAARLQYFAKALSAYWDWVAAGRQLAIAEALLALAEARDQQLADAVALGQVAAIERTDNQRAILQRRSALALARRGLEQRAIELSLYYRGPDGAPLRPGTDRLPPLEAPPAVPLPAEADDVRVALERRPEVLARRVARDQQDVELRLAENTLLPSLNFFSEASREGGRASKVEGSEFEVGVAFKLPVQRRKAAGATAKARAGVAKATVELQWAEDQVRADVQDARSAVTAAFDVLDVVRGEVDVARELERLERDRFDLGDSTQFLVNLRELSTADAAMREARALADAQKALARLAAATGRLLASAP